MRPFHSLLAALLFAEVLLVTAAAADVDYDKDVAPMLRKYCAGCHNDDEPEGGLSMDSYPQLMEGGDSGLAVTQRVPGSSRMFLMLTGKLEPVMPPEDEPRPSEEEQAILASWIEQGAVGTSGDAPIRQPLRTPKIKTAPGVLGRSRR